MNTHQQVVNYTDDLKHRAFPHRFRKVGNPYAFLNDVGIIPILEYIYKGNLLIDVAEELNVSYTVLQRWAEEENHADAIDEAQRISAEGYLADGLRRLRTASNEFELKRAKEMIAHARFMASKKDKHQYGGTEQQGAVSVGVQYTFNITGAAATPDTINAAPLATTYRTIEPELLPVVAFAFDAPPEPTPSPAPAPAPRLDTAVAAHLKAFGVDKAFDTLFAPTPLPTPDAPEIGPFHD